MEKTQERENSFCRLCLTASVVYYSLLKDNGKEMLFSLTGIEIDKDHPYSTESCVKCWLDLKLAYNIQQSFVEAEKKFQLTGIHAVESKLELKAPEIDSDPTETDPKKLCIEAIFKQEDIENDIPEDFPNMSDNESEYPELIFIQADDENADDIVMVDEKPCICFICGKECDDDALLYSHINKHYSEPQPCDECAITLPNISSYREHIQAKHPKLFNTPYTCGICSLSFKYLPLYDLHLAAVHPETARIRNRRRDVSQYNPGVSKYRCEECNKSFRNKQAHNTHVKGHSRKPCPICGAEITVYNLNKHITNHEAAPAVCHLCGITSKNPESLRGHMYYTHSKKRLTCEECGRVFKKLYAYKMHIKKEHTGERTFTCDTCGKRFFTNYELNSHIKTTHLKERPHICKFCNKGFSSRFSMRTHERQHTNEVPYVCEICGEGFRQNVSLRAHRKSKHNIIESKNAECPICRKMFRDDWALKSHTRSVHD